MKALKLSWLAAVACAAGAVVTWALEDAPRPALDLTGTWAGVVTHAGETQTIALDVTPAEEGTLLLKLSAPVVHLAHSPFARVRPKVEGERVELGPFVLTYDARAQTLAGVVPAGLAPVHALPVTLRRVERLDLPERPAPGGALVQPQWTFDAGAPLWAGPTVADGVVYAGGDDGVLHALDAATGRARWAFRAGGPIRTRATVSGGDVYFQADDGFLYRLAAPSGQEAWRVRVVDKPVVRLPFDDPKSRYDRFGSDVTAAGGRLYLGTHDGRLLAVAPQRGERVWEYAAGDSILAAPAVVDERVCFGSFDHRVYALEAASGRLVWSFDTQAPVVSTPAVTGNRVVIGNRSYDLFGLDLQTGRPAWTRYIWFSWVESSASIRDSVAYVGSSDAAAVFAFEARSGQRLWQADVFGWAWGQPAVTQDRVYVGTASQLGYLADHRGGVFALERVTGRALWRYTAQPPEKGSYGFPGSPAVGAGLVFLTGLDGRVYAFAQ